MLLRTIVLLAAVAGCTGGDRGGGVMHVGGMACPVAAGTFRVTYTENGGDCGPLPSADVAAGGDWCTGVPMGCDGTRVCSADRCSVDTDLACDLPDGSGGTFESRGTMHVVSANELRAVLTITLYDAGGAMVCESNYDVTWTR